MALDVLPDIALLTGYLRCVVILAMLVMGELSGCR